jgi:hypothetical protein
MMLNKTLLLAACAAVAVMLAGNASADVMVQWGAPGGENIISNHQAFGRISTYDPVTAINPAYGANGYYIDSSNRTTTIYGAITAGSCEIREAGTTDEVWLAEYVSGIGGVVKAMFAWKSPDFMTERKTTVTNFSLNIYGDAPQLAYTNRWLVEKSGQFYVSQETFGVFNGNTDASTLSWFEYTPMTGGVDVIGASASVTLHDLDAVGFYVHATAISDWDGWRRPKFDYFAVQGITDPLGMVFMLK